MCVVGEARFRLPSKGSKSRKENQICIQINVCKVESAEILSGAGNTNRAGRRFREDGGGAAFEFGLEGHGPLGLCTQASPTSIPLGLSAVPPKGGDVPLPLRS